MSLRSIRGLPTCLRGRLAHRQPAKSAPKSNPILHASAIHRPQPFDSSQTQPPAKFTNYAAVHGNNTSGGDLEFYGAGFAGQTRRERWENDSHSFREPRVINAADPEQDVTTVRPSSTIFREPRGINVGSALAPPSRGATVEDHDTDWTALHDKFVEVRRTAPEKTSEVFEKHMALANKLVNSSTYDRMSEMEFTRRWLALRYKVRARLLPSILIGSLVHSAAQCLFVLSNTSESHRTFRIRMNCLRHIGIMYQEDLRNDSNLQRSYEELIAQQRSPESWPADDMPAVLLHSLLRWSTPEQCETIISEFQTRYPDANEDYLTFVVDHYLGLKDGENAFKYFQCLSPDTLQKPDKTVRALRDGLLKLDVVVKSDNGTNFRFLPQLLAMGLPSDESLHNTVIESAITNGLPEVAWDVYEYLETSEFYTSAHSHLVLLRDAFQRGDLPRVNKIMTAIHGREDLTCDQYLMAYSMNIVRAICCYERKLRPNEALAHMMALYDRAYDREPLANLRIVRAKPGGGNLPPPTPTLLAFTVWSHVLTQQHTYNNMRLWVWMKHLIADGDKAVIEAASYDIIYNGLILFHARRADGLVRCLDVVQYMLSNKLCLPTSRTWSILLCAFLKHGQVDQAQRVMQMMQQKGFRIEEIYEQYHDHVPGGISLEDLKDIAGQALDEKELPLGLEDLMSHSSSLQEPVDPVYK